MSLNNQPLIYQTGKSILRVNIPHIKSLRSYLAKIILYADHANEQMMSWRNAASSNCTRARKPIVSAYYYSNSSIPVGYFGTTIRRRPVGFGFEAPFQNRRNFTNSRERWRQHHVNMAFGELRKLLPTYPPDKKLSKHEILKLSMKYISFLSGVLKGMDSNQAEFCPDCVMDPSKCSPSSSSATSSSDGILSARLDLEHVSVDSLTSQIRLEEEGD